MAGPASSQISPTQAPQLLSPELDFHVHGQRALDLVTDPGCSHGPWLGELANAWFSKERALQKSWVLDLVILEAVLWLLSLGAWCSLSGVEHGHDVLGCLKETHQHHFFLGPGVVSDDVSFLLSSFPGSSRTSRQEGRSVLKFWLNGVSGREIRLFPAGGVLDTDSL